MARLNIGRWHNFLSQLVRPEVIDATRSWFANLTAIASTIVALVLTGFLYWGAWTAETETIRISTIAAAVIITHVEVMMGIFYLHRLALKAVELNAGAVELDITTEQTAAKVVGPVSEVKEIVKEVTPNNV